MISSTDYKLAADNINFINIQEQDILQLSHDIKEDVDEINNESITNQDVTSFSNYLIGFYDITLNEYVVNQALYEIVKRLQAYVEKSYQTDINSFLSDNGIKVKIVFADISSSVGYDIDASNIET